MQRVGFAGMEGIDFVLNRRADIDADELAAIVAALRGIKWEEAQQHVERINGWLRRFKAEPLTDVTHIQQPRRKQPPPARSADARRLVSLGEASKDRNGAALPNSTMPCNKNP
jgi:hypothetical protein